MTTLKPQKFGIVIKHNVNHALTLAKEVSQWFVDHKKDIFIADDAGALDDTWPTHTRLPKEKLPERVDLILVFGGDGTFLSIARQMVTHSVPILGVNLGQLGFLTEFAVSKIMSELNNLCTGNFAVENRTMLETSVWRGGKSIFSRPVLNDAVITNGDIARILDTELVIDKVSAAAIKADGIIVSTPTGSTAYSLAAGGPIVHPAVAATTIAAICPHSLTIRPIVVPETSKIEVKVSLKTNKALLTLDGQFGYDLAPGDTVAVTKFERHALQIVRPKNQEYFDVLRNKLKLGARGEGN